MNKNNYKPLPPFKGWVLQNFPFIEEDFDAITSYQLWCKVVEYINTIAYNQNILETSNNELIAKFNELKDYVDNYFKNLDIQEEVDNKLDELVTDGTIENIIKDIIISYNENPFNNTLFVGDSYILGRFNDGNQDTEQLTSWATTIINNNNLQNCYIMGQSGGGIAHTPPGGYNFRDYIQNHLSKIDDVNSIKNVVICAGYNDYRYNSTEITTAVNNLYDYLKTTFPNVTKIYLGMIGNNSENNSNGFNIRYNLYYNTLVGYKNIVRKGGIYLDGVETILKNYNFYSDTDTVHPNQNGQNQLAYYIYQAMIKGQANTVQVSSTGNITHANKLDTSTFSFNMTSYGSLMKCYINSGRLNYSTNVNISNNVMYLGVLETPLYRSTLGRIVIPVIANVNNTNYNAFLRFNSDGTADLLFTNTGSTSLPASSNAVNIIGSSFEIPIIQC